MFPLVLGSLSDAIVAIHQISKFLIAEEIGKPYAIDIESEFAINVDGDFTWETSGKPVGVGHKSAEGGGAAGDELDDGAKKPKQKTGQKNTERKDLLCDKSAKAQPILPTATSGTTVENDTYKTAADEKPFELCDLKLKIPKGSFVAIIGHVGSGKVTKLILLVLIMRGLVTFCNHLELSFGGADWRNAEDEGSCALIEHAFPASFR